MFTIRQTADGWEVLAADGTRVGDPHPSYDHALAVIAGALADATAAAGDVPVDGTGNAGLLPEVWEDVEGLAFSEMTPDGRDFTGCAWSFRDPAVSTLPLMLQTETEMGHFGAELAGFFETISVSNGVVHGSGRFYDSEAGVTFRDMLLEGRTFGVSVDPGMVDVVYECVETDAEGWCTQESVSFTAYEVIGVTGTPFPAFPHASIRLQTADTQQTPAPAAPPAVAASAAPVEPPAEWFHMPEPEHGSELLVEQDGGALAVPLTITDEGQVFGHLAYWGQCHTGYAGVCVTPPASASNYSQFHLGEVLCAGGERVAAGPLVVGCDHADLSMFAADARDHYAHAGLQWADVRISDGVYGPWVCGAVHPDITDEQLRVLRVSSLSGDWRRIAGELDLIMPLTVNNPGFPIRREALAASGLRVMSTPHVGARTQGGVQQALVASSIVRRQCRECGQASHETPGQIDTPATLAEMHAMLRRIDRRTAHLAPAAAQAVVERMTR